MKHAVEIILTLSATFKGSADQQCVNAETDHRTHKTFSMYTKALFLSNIVHKSV